jgi:hypothetical protein
VDLIKLLRGPALDAISEFVMSAAQIDKMVTAPLKGIIEEIKAGKTWKGPSADAFVAVLQNEHVAASQIITEQLETMHKNYTRNIELIDQADTRSQGQVNALDEQFGNVFR